MMLTDYALLDPSSVPSPALLFYKALIRSNIQQAIRVAGGPERLRPHVKTHKSPDVVRMTMEAGITRHKCATIAEAEMVAGCGATDVLLAYPLVGPNIERMMRLAIAFPACRFLLVVDHPLSLQALSTAADAAHLKFEVLVDVDVGQHRTGIGVGAAAEELYTSLAHLPGVQPGGLHVYDGHNHQESVAERESAVRTLLDPVLRMREQLERKGIPVPRLVVGGTPTFPVFARLDLPGLECSPGTLVIHDHGYHARFADLEGFVPAATILTRVVSKPLANRLTLDVGTKAVASDPPAGKRLVLLNLGEYVPVVHNEEHFVVDTPHADRHAPGDVFYAVPTHICPTVALHKEALVVEDGRVTDRWPIVARDRTLTV